MNLEIETINQGLIDDDVYGYELKSPYSFLRFGYNPSSNVFHFYAIGTTPIYRRQGHATELLNELFEEIIKLKAALNMGTYTKDGEDFIKHKIEKFVSEHDVRLIQGRYDN